MRTALMSPHEIPLMNNDILNDECVDAIDAIAGMDGNYDVFDALEILIISKHSGDRKIRKRARVMLRSMRTGTYRWRSGGQLCRTRDLTDAQFLKGRREINKGR